MLKLIYLNEEVHDKMLTKEYDVHNIYLSFTGANKIRCSSNEQQFLEVRLELWRAFSCLTNFLRITWCV